MIKEAYCSFEMSKLLKGLPKWKKVNSNPAKFQYNLQGTRLYKDGEYYIESSDKVHIMTTTEKTMFHQ